MKLQELTGLTDADPIHRYLGLVDKILGEFDWNNLDFSSKLMAEVVFYYLNHPVLQPTVEDIQLDSFEKYLEENEPLFATIVNKLRRHKEREGMGNYEIRIVMVWIAANIDYLKERSKPGRRLLNAGWKPSCE